MATLWRPDWPPETPSAYDDEFVDASLAAAWTELDNDSILTVAEVASGLRLSHAGTTWGLAGIYKAMPPSGDWAAWTKISLDMVDGAQIIMAGLFLAVDLDVSPTGAPFVDIGLRYDTAFKYQVRSSNWTSYNPATFGIYTTLEDAIAPTALYVRMRYTAATGAYAVDFSTDGIGWQQLRADSRADAKHVGLYVASNTGSARVATFQFFRMVEGTVALTDVMAGRRVDLENPPAEPYRVPRSPAYYYQ